MLHLFSQLLYESFIQILIFFSSIDYGKIDDKYITILVALSSINLALLAFVYPKIFETTRKLKDISKIFIDKLNAFFYIKHYLTIVTCCLLLDISAFFINCFPVSSFVKFNIIVFIFIYSLVAIVISIWSYRKLNTYYNNPEQLFALEKIDITKNKRNPDLELVQILAIHSFVKQYDLSQFNTCLEFLEKIFLKNIQKQKKDIDSSILIYPDDNYIYRPIDMLVYIHQRAIDANNIEVANITLGKIFSILYESLNIKNNSNTDLIKQLITNLINIIYYKVSIHKLDYYYTNIISSTYCNLFLYDQKQGNNECIRFFNEHTFYLIEKIVNTNFNNEILKNWRKEFYNIAFAMESSKEIQQLNILILSYILYRKEYDLLYKFLFFESPIESTINHRYYTIPKNITEIVYCFISKDSPFNYLKEFDDNHTNAKYKYYILFIIIGIIKSRMDYSQKQYSQNYYIDIPCDFIEKLSYDLTFNNCFNNIKNTIDFIRELFKLKDIINIFSFTAGYKFFILRQLIRIQKKIDDRKNILLTTPIQEDLKEKILAKIESHFMRINFLSSKLSKGIKKNNHSRINIMQCNVRYNINKEQLFKYDFAMLSTLTHEFSEKVDIKIFNALKKQLTPYLSTKGIKDLENYIAFSNGFNNTQNIINLLNTNNFSYDGKTHKIIANNQQITFIRTAVPIKKQTTIIFLNKMVFNTLNHDLNTTITEKLKNTDYMINIKTKISYTVETDHTTPLGFYIQ